MLFFVVIRINDWGGKCGDGERTLAPEFGLLSHLHCLAAARIGQATYPFIPQFPQMQNINVNNINLIE